jgi:hypothetical protein
MNPRIIKVKALKNFMLELEFSNNECKIFDAKPYLHYPIYEPLNDAHFFSAARVSLGTVVWDDEIDFSPDTLYIESKSLQPA